MNHFTLVSSAKKYDDTVFIVHDGSKNVAATYREKQSHNKPHIEVGGVYVYADLSLHASGLIHLAQVVYAVEVARFVWPSVSEVTK